MSTYTPVSLFGYLVKTCKIAAKLLQSDAITLNTITDKFSDIRPYHDDEVEAVIARIISNKEFIAAISQLKFPGTSTLLRQLISPFVRFLVRRQTRDVKTVKNFQEKIEAYAKEMILSTMTSFTVSGLENIDPDKAYLFISNHRDIALDPTVVNYALHINGHDTVRIAIGDNLLSKEFVSDLMRINKSFIVKRSLQGPRQLLASLKVLSSYIAHSLHEDNQSVWLAQREGRAKDGLDKTDPAIIKMLTLNARKQPFHEVIQSMNIVPVAVSYEYDPCDLAKGMELYQLDKEGDYKKDQHEDIDSIAKGISGFKGRVHLSFGDVVKDHYHSVDDIVDHLDRSILNIYKIPPSHYFAYEELFGELPDRDKMMTEFKLSPDQFDMERQTFQVHLEKIPEQYRSYVLWGYANPLVNKIAAGIL